MTLLTALVLSFGLSQDAKPMPLIHATALSAVGGRLYAGTNNGEIHIYDARTREPLSMITSERKGIVASVSASKEGVAWVIGSRPMGIRDRLGSQESVEAQTLIVRTPDDKTYTIDLKPAGVDSPVRSLAWFGPRVALIKDFGVNFYNAQSHAVELPENVLPKSMAEEAARSRVWFQQSCLMTARPVSLRRNPKSTGLPYVSLFTVYKQEDFRWKRLGGFASNALDVEPIRELNVGEDGKIPSSAQFTILSETADLGAAGITAIEGGSLLDAPVFKPDWESVRKPLPDWYSTSGRPDPLWFQVVGDDAWWWSGGVLMKQSRTTGLAKAFLPWNDPQMLPNAFLADEGGVWIATNVGVRRAELATPEKPLGFGGFISAPLGAIEEKTDHKTSDKLVRELYRWRFATADLAGKDGSLMVGSVFKAIGISLPASASGILASPNGISVSDQLKIGDILYSSKILSIYIGNGKTVELKDGVVKNGDIWSRSFTTVRRFIRQDKP